MLSDNSVIPVGVRFMMLSALGFALMSACVKLASARGIPLMEIVAARALVSLAISYADVHRKGLSPWGRNRLLLFARGAVGTFALVCFYYAVTTLPLAESTLIQYTHPVFTAILALIFLGERVNGATLVCIGLSILGLLLIVQPGVINGDSAQLPSFSVFAALLGALGSSVAYVLVRRLSREEDTSVIIMYFPLVALPVSLLLPGDSFVMLDGQAVLLLLMVGLFTQVGQWGMTHAMRTEQAAKASAYSYVQVIFAAILGWLVFGDLPNTATWLGGTLIIGGALFNMLRR